MVCDMECTRVGTRIVRHETAADFLEVCGEWLSEQEDIHNGVLSLAHGLGSGQHIHTPPFVFAHIEVNNRIAGCTIFAEPDGISLSEMPVDAVGKLFSELRSDINAPSRIHGPEGPANRLAKCFAELSNSKPVLHSEWNVYRLDDPPNKRQVAGGMLRVGNESDSEIVSAWGALYDAEKPTTVNIERFLRRKLKDGLLYFWVDTGPRALLTLSGINCSGNRISSVFTPEQFRGRGYATSLVCEISTRLLAEGKSFVTLNTEIGDPAERIYENLGYRIVGKRVSIVFVRAA